MRVNGKEKKTESVTLLGGLAGLVLRPLLLKLRGACSPKPRLELLERISLAPRQTLALVEADGQRFLVATSAEGGSAFHALDARLHPSSPSSSRVSW